jgi:hypothetical protein
MSAHSARRVRRAPRGAQQDGLSEWEWRLDARFRLYCRLVRTVFVTLLVVAWMAFEIVRVAEGHEPVAQTLKEIACELR